jgi:hypothetical protein
MWCCIFRPETPWEIETWFLPMMVISLPVTDTMDRSSVESELEQNTIMVSGGFSRGGRKVHDAPGKKNTSRKFC